MRTEGFCPPAMETRPTPVTWEIFWARLVSAASSILSSGQRVGGERERHDGRVGGVDLAVDGRIGQVGGQEGVGGVDGGLHFLLGHVDVFVEVELEGDDGAAAGADGGHLLQAGHLAELAFQRRGDGRGHDIGSGAGIEGEDLDDGVVHFGQGGDRQLQVGDTAREQMAAISSEVAMGRRMNGRDGLRLTACLWLELGLCRVGRCWPAGRCLTPGAELVLRALARLDSAAGGPRLTVTGWPGRRRSAPSMTTLAPGAGPLSRMVFWPSARATFTGCICAA